MPLLLFVDCVLVTDEGAGGGGGGGFLRFGNPLGRHRSLRRTFPSFIITGGAGTQASNAFVLAS